MEGGETCAGGTSEAYAELECTCVFERGQLAVHLSDGANLCVACWDRLADLMEARDGERPDVS
jgi:hypothetical protein